MSAFVCSKIGLNTKSIRTIGSIVCTVPTFHTQTEHKMAAVQIKACIYWYVPILRVPMVIFLKSI